MHWSIVPRCYYSVFLRPGYYIVVHRSIAGQMAIATTTTSSWTQDYNMMTKANPIISANSFCPYKIAI